jgi:hypothetical protein
MRSGINPPHFHTGSISPSCLFIVLGPGKIHLIFTTFVPLMLRRTCLHVCICLPEWHIEVEGNERRIAAFNLCFGLDQLESCSAT